ncbi:PREDICTED: uncharacterized protein LOC105568033 [Vollenhovia emeryi]|uniref:uncharacterized protein LOC105568033 n=1 Tax=Vollenhovia emeryi TaxID=411798 RepID=UPI0005F492EF|nr:PREDICTED: uncharacterized protein LOC105568033 [Vollenhovia emeryi]
MAPADKSSSPEPPRREAGGGCPPPNCSHPSTRCNSPNTNCASTAPSCCPSQRGYPRAVSHRAPNCQPCALRSILKKRSCCQCNNTNRCCLCQPMPRACNCPPPIQVDARATRECSCDFPFSPECACPPGERRFPRATVECPNARLCCPSPRLPPGPKCYCPPCQPCPPPTCGPCIASSKCRRSLPLKEPCSPCPSCPPCRRPVPTASPCRPSTPCRKLTFCTERGGRPSSSCTGQSWRAIIDDKSSESSMCSEQCDDERRELHSEKGRDCRYAADCAGSETGSKCTDENRNLMLNNRQNSTSKTFTNLSETTNPSKSVDPDSRDVSGERDGTAFENAAETLEGCTAEKSSKDSWYTSPAHAPCDSGVEPDCCASHEENPHTGGNASGNLVSARLSSRLKSLSRLKDLSAPNKTLLRRGVTFRDAPQARVGPCWRVLRQAFRANRTDTWDRQATQGWWVLGKGYDRC